MQNQSQFRRPPRFTQSTQTEITNQSQFPYWPPAPPGSCAFALERPAPFLDSVLDFETRSKMQIQSQFRHRRAPRSPHRRKYKPKPISLLGTIQRGVNWLAVPNPEFDQPGCEAD